MSTPAASVQITEYTVSCIPDHGSPNRELWSLLVEYRGNDRWAVRYNGLWLGRDGMWGDEFVRQDEWSHRFTEKEALRLAVEWAPRVRTNGKTAPEVLAWEAAMELGVTAGDGSRTKTSI
jgi:hypothetical protein